MPRAPRELNFNIKASRNERLEVSFLMRLSVLNVSKSHDDKNIFRFKALPFHPPHSGARWHS